MNFWSEYVLARSIEEALHALAEAPGPACPVAGGTDLLLEIQQGHRPPVHTLVDITQIPELNCLELQEDLLRIGAAVPVAELTESSLIHEHALALAEACGLIGGPQVRNTATLGGNVAHALPAADGMIALVALDAQVEIASAQGIRRQPVLSLFRGPGKSALALEREFIVAFLVPGRRSGQASAFERVMRPQGVALPVLNLAAWLERAGDRIQAIRIAIGPAGPVPQRATAVEDCLRGARLDDQTFALALAQLRATMRFRTSPQRATAAYRYDLGEVLLGSVLKRVWNLAAF